MEKLIKEHNLNNGTILFGAGELDDVNQALGSVRTELNNMFNLAKEGFNFV